MRIAASQQQHMRQLTMQRCHLRTNMEVYKEDSRNKQIASKVNEE